ncbi:MAG: ABC transporter ATP-binding protein [Pseudomonadota bacterium]
MTPDARLELIDLTCRFNGVTAVDGVCLALSPGEVTCLLGPSGCGKSTTLRVAAGVERATSGQVLIDGRLVEGNGVSVPPERRGVGMMFQDFALFPHLTAAGNVAFGVGRGAGNRVADLLERVGLANKSDRYPHQLSGGEQQRVALARALAPRPRVMLMDEPFSGLDNRLRDGIRDETLDILKEEGTAVLLVTHEPNEAMRMANQIALMRAGRIVQRGAPYNIYNNPVDAEAAAFFSDINILHGVVENFQTSTPFGQFFCPNMRDGADVEIVIRPQHLRMDFDRQGSGPRPTASDGVPARGVVERARYIGNESLVDLRMEHDGSLLRATIPGVFMPAPGRKLWISLRRDRCFVFPCGRQTRVANPFLTDLAAE